MTECRPAANRTQRMESLAGQAAKTATPTPPGAGSAQVGAWSARAQSRCGGGRDGTADLSQVAAQRDSAVDFAQSRNTEISDLRERLAREAAGALRQRCRAARLAAENQVLRKRLAAATAESQVWGMVVDELEWLVDIGRALRCLSKPAEAEMMGEEEEDDVQKHEEMSPRGEQKALSSVMGDLTPRIQDRELVFEEPSYEPLAKRRRRPLEP